MLGRFQAYKPQKDWTRKEATSLGCSVPFEKHPISIFGRFSELPGEGGYLIMGVKLLNYCSATPEIVMVDIMITMY